MSRMIRTLFILPIRAYQKFISPFLGNNCRFIPSCSAYMIQAIEIHGVIKGILLGTWRILRCNPFCKGGIDPVPPKGRWRNDPDSKKEVDHEKSAQ